jgi:hypothetical protein
VELSSEKQDLQ